MKTKKFYLICFLFFISFVWNPFLFGETLKKHVSIQVSLIIPERTKFQVQVDKLEDNSLKNNTKCAVINASNRKQVINEKDVPDDIRVYIANIQKSVQKMDSLNFSQIRNNFIFTRVAK